MLIFLYDFYLFFRFESYACNLLSRIAKKLGKLVRTLISFSLPVLEAQASFSVCLLSVSYLHVNISLICIKFVCYQNCKS